MKNSENKMIKNSNFKNLRKIQYSFGKKTRVQLRTKFKTFVKNIRFNKQLYPREARI